MNDLLLRAANGERTPRPPVWLMRQAGRHLPEYRELRSQYSFREAITDPDVAVEITLQPWHRYEPDGVVIFSDILTVLEPLGIEYAIEPGVGPKIPDPITEPAAVPRTYSDVDSTLEFVGEIMNRLDDRVGNQVPLIGFAGGPFTLASYAIAGGSSRSHLAVRRFRSQFPAGFESFLDILADIVRDHLVFQIESGADVVQLFDTYAGVLSPQDYREFVLPLHRRILSDLSVPTIVFARNMSGALGSLAESGADVIGLDWTIDMASARETLGDTPVQGNLDPAYLFGDPEFIRDRTLQLIDAAGETGHILNLGHGVHKSTPISGVETFIETAKSVSR